MHETREEMSREADYDMDLFAEMVRSGMRPGAGRARYIRGVMSVPPPQTDADKLPKNKLSSE